MNRPEYVWLITKTFREAIDAYYRNETYCVTKKRQEELKLMFNRGFSEGHLFHDDVTKRMSQYRPNHQLYIGADVGHVSGQSAQYLLGQTLAGGAIGLRGQVKAGGNLNYDVFASKAFKKPDFFQTKRVVTGFNLSYSF